MSADKEISHYELIEQKVLFEETQTLDDTQLLSLIIRDSKDNQLTKAEKLISNCDELTQLLNLSINEIVRISGVNKKQAISLCATFELIKRISGDSVTQKIDTIKNHLDIISLFKEKFSRLNHEEFWAVYLTGTNKVIKTVKINSGGGNSLFADIKLILKNGIELLATAIIVVHNHPTSDSTPSQDDIAFTNKLNEAMSLVEIKFLDHLIISKSDSYSFLESAQLSPIKRVDDSF